MKAIVSVLMMILSAAVSFHASAETVSGRETSGDRYAWQYGFDVGIADGSVNVRVAVNWVPVAGVTWPELEVARKRWVEGILKVWDNRYQVVTPEGKTYPIRVTVSSSAPDAHHDVIVRRTGRGTNELNWNLYDTATHAAHEFGHMLGAFDEYPGGALASADESGHRGIMAGRSSGETLPRHYEKVRKWFVEQAGTADIRLLPVSDRAESMKGNGHPL